MRKAKKREAESFIQLLAKAHHQIKKSIESKNIPAALDLLEQCQCGAIELGTMIEQEEGEGFVTVSFLERYCELTYQIHEKLRDEPSADAVRINRDLKRCLIQIENSVKNDIKERIVAVFLPYKASMWDSLESVWRAACKDSDCETYVIPIPYYDKNVDGSFREIHDEADLFPADVPITRYDAFDFGQMHPDLIFIHNPYDNNNYVTSVHPFFYSDHLKQYTDLLVYIPYYITDEISPNSQADIESIKHFITTPAVIHADRVIVQSEDMRNIYINVLTEMTGADEAGRQYWEQKIRGLGSPKVDRILHTRKEDLEVPAAWKRIIQRPDGTRKKIIFYNTSIAALLEHNEQMLVKIQDVLRVFWEKREEVALLWRPHPLIESTLTSMRPMLWEQYQKIRDSYIADGWGIYDDSADMNRALALSDAYYGDGSSLVALYEKTGKLCMKQNVSVLGSFEHVWSYGVAMEGDLIWFVPYWHNLLCCYSLRNQKMEYQIEIPQEDAVEGLYHNLVKAGNDIVLIPGSASQICVFDTERRIFRTYPLPAMEVRMNKFLNSAVYGDKVYLFPLCAPLVLCVDLKNDRVRYMDDWAKNCSYAVGGNILGRQCYQYGHMAYLLLASDNGFMECDLAAESIRIVHCGEQEERYIAICRMTDEKLWLMNQKGESCICKRAQTGSETAVILEADSSGREWTDQEPSVICAIYDRDTTYFFPGQGIRMFGLGADHRFVERKKFYQNFEDYKESGDYKAGTAVSVLEQDGDYAFGFHTVEQYFFALNLQTETMKKYDIALDGLPMDYTKKCLEKQKDWLKGAFPEMEIAYLRLSYFLRMVQSGQKVSCDVSGENRGDLIYRSLKQEAE